MKQRMLHTMLALVLVLMLALTPAMGLAAELGTLTGEALGNAWAAGRQITGVFKASLTALTGNVLNDEESQAVVAAIGELLEGASINVSAVQVDEDTVRLSASAMLQNQSVIDAAVEANAERITVVTSVLPGKRIVIDTAQLAEMMDEEIPGEEDVTEMSEGVASYIGGALVRYGAVLVGWFQALPVTEGGAQDATDNCDAIAGTLTYNVTGEDVKALAMSLMEAMEGDEQLLAYLDEAGTFGNEEINALTAIKQAKEDLADEDMSELAIELVLGLDSQDELIAMSLLVEEDGQAMSMLVGTKTAEDASVAVTMIMNVTDGGEEVVSYEYVVGMTNPEADQVTTTMSGSMYAEEDGNVISADYAAEGKKTVAETSESLEFTMSMLMNMLYGDKADLSTDTVNMRYSILFNTDVTDEDFDTTLDLDVDMDVTADPSMTIGYGMGISLASAAYEADAGEYTDVELFNLSEEELENLVIEGQTGATQALFKALNLIPSDLLTMMMAQ